MAGSTGQVVIDSTDIPAHEKPSKQSSTGASFGHRTASAGEDEVFYGYKLHLAAVNTDEGPVPIAVRVAPANCSDVDKEIIPELKEKPVISIRVFWVINLLIILWMPAITLVSYTVRRSTRTARQLSS